MSKNLSEVLLEKFPGSVIEMEEIPTDHIPLNGDKWFEIALFIRDEPDWKFDSLQCITGVDLGEENGLEVRYNLHSMVHSHKIEIRIPLNRDKPVVPSVEQVWRVGDWFEREVYDMYGITFKGHRDLRRILLPDDWEGWPLRKDYEEPATYHGIAVPKEKEGWE
ncbi:MAG TPA: NADH-quinone oxidoreductase subunit C [Candidatus Marinimicrobia bacterium]|jgi:NADH-quinone oxidoreductase subunit C|nr:NADH-quinone oxidoreductase subunit C [Candidatus Neomarinimicrobiota bacterium]MDP6143145.1 NADH-quinone oxidoreductase subunit C [Candidatus Neomarinimicrobiota bacterium]MDP6260556.1 NADH-quinone oxidoreductase subunit C [Candidatus Neomarinimicrobiota bacterium]MDP7128536.1 NADH-quinone oxidoreductase subunit C [Candidatus Neomarinimicrobiota bacterium]MDP7336313.1 NADH-quinone oxidoreductase subunit C [Candidatus Neomarinimicrobiota bacterium]|tara:strand:+ start:1024 stop:1515 length:492 start_codon:yes stop_codon:yes gene_type:complete